MKVPLNWLRDYVELTITPAQLAERLTLAGLELGGVAVHGLPVPAGLRVKQDELGPVWDRDKIFIAEVLSVDKHPDADRLSLPLVRYGEGLTKTLVTGAPNIKVGDKGQKVVLALSGSTLYDGHSEEKKLKTLKPSKIRGVPSDAMVCSERELGLSGEHEGIIILEDDAPVGMPLADFMGDIVLDLDVLPNMARCLSLIGVAREVAALTGQRIKLPESRGAGVSPAQLAAVQASRPHYEILIEDPTLCARYAAMLITGVTIGKSPGWMQRRLGYAGMRPINNIVDITNYVMLEWGQPLHAFDYDLLVQRAGGKPPTISVRSARAGEILTTLDGQKRELTPDNLVIADTQGPIALAGVMGGAETEVTANTRNILLESASFDFISIRRTMKAFNLPSEASARFSRGIHPEIVKPAAERAAQLMAEHAGGSVSPGIVDVYPAPLPPQVCKLDMKKVRRLLGIDMPTADALKILRALEYDVKELDADTLQATVPPHRRDFDTPDGQADLMEDLARIYGYDHMPATLLADRLPEQHTNASLVFEERVKNLLVSAGLQEAISYALTTPEVEAAFVSPSPLTPLPQGERGRGEGDYVRLLNPISSERVVMRKTVLPGVIEAVAANLRHSSDVRLFEVGHVYLPSPSSDRLPAEPRRLAIVLSGKRAAEFWKDGAAKDKGESALDFFDLKGVIEALAHDLHLPEVQYRPSTAAYLHPGQAATLVAQGKPLGDFGKLHPKLAQQLGLEDRGVLVAEFDLEAMQGVVPERYTFSPVPRFPAALRDIAIVVAEAVTAEQLENEIRAGGGKLLAGVTLFDVYRGDSIAAGAKSVAYALSYQAEDRTLTDKEVDKAHQKIEERLKRTLNAQIRGKEQG